MILFLGIVENGGEQRERLFASLDKCLRLNILKSSKRAGEHTEACFNSISMIRTLANPNRRDELRTEAEVDYILIVETAQHTCQRYVQAVRIYMTAQLVGFFSHTI